MGTFFLFKYCSASNRSVTLRVCEYLWGMFTVVHLACLHLFCNHEIVDIVNATKQSKIKNCFFYFISLDTVFPSGCNRAPASASLLTLPTAKAVTTATRSASVWSCQQWPLGVTVSFLFALVTSALCSLPPCWLD